VIGQRRFALASKHKYRKRRLVVDGKQLRAITVTVHLIDLGCFRKQHLD
jgi:hypothetical protein